MFWCITCDGYASTGKRVVVIGNTNVAAVEALQLKRFTPDLTLLTDSHTWTFDAPFEKRLADANIQLIYDRIRDVEGVDGHLTALDTQGDRRLELDHLFCEHGATPDTKLAEDLDVLLNRAGYISVDSEQKTNVPGVYAAGDVTRLHSHQVSTAVHEGGQAASAANYYLYPPELRLRMSRHEAAELAAQRARERVQGPLTLPD